MLKSLRFLPLCVLIFSGYALAHEHGNPSSDSYASKRAAVEASAAKVAAASGVDDLLSDLKSGAIKSKSGVRGSKSDSALVSYLNVVRNRVMKQLGDSLDIYKGKKCSVKVGFSRDGTVIYAVDYAGDSEFCNTVTLAIRNIKFPPPPSEHIYQLVKDGIFDFNP
ncbi:hypothetical protein G5H88_001467 [Salmonella enterica subsp. enterica serovar Florida]|nr:hypothetical protein [Salmonella enterica subsp. enterica serovar Florida]